MSSSHPNSEIYFTYRPPNEPIEQLTRFRAAHAAGLTLRGLAFPALSLITRQRKIWSARMRAGLRLETGIRCVIRRSGESDWDEISNDQRELASLNR